MSYEDAPAALDIDPSEQGVIEQKTAGEGIARFQLAWSDLKHQDLAKRVLDAYAPDTFFNDTVKTLRTADDVASYLVKSAEALEAGGVEFLDHARNDAGHYLRWRMTLRLKRYAKGRDLVSVGMSHLRLDETGNVVLHQDFWDSNGGLIEHFPIVGSIIRWVKGRF